MQLTRAVAGVTTAVLLGLVPLTAHTSAQAQVRAKAEVNYVTTTASVEGSRGRTSVEAGDEILLIGDVTGVDTDTGLPVDVLAGDLTLQVSTSRTPAWTTVDTHDVVLGLYLHAPDSNAQYRVVYAGGSLFDDVYLASESAPLAIDVQRQVRTRNPGGGNRLRITVTPDFGGKRLKILSSAREKKGYRLFRKLRTNSRGEASIRLPARRTRTYFTVVAPGDADFARAEDHVGYTLAR